MATNNYCGFTYSETQYGAVATGAAYPAQAQANYAVALAAVATYETQRHGYDQSYQAAAATQSLFATTTNTTTYSNYYAALYSAATMYVAQQTNNTNQNTGWQQYKKPGQQNMGMNKQRTKAQQPRPQQLHYCEVCKIICAGPQIYREHLEGQKHKKCEANLKMQASAAATTQNRGNNHHCELYDVTCIGNDAYAAHVRGSKDQKVVKLHQKLGKPIPSSDPKKATAKIHFVPADDGTPSNDNNGTGIGGGTAATTVPNNSALNPTVNNKNEEIPEDDHISDDIKPIGVEYIDEINDEEGKILSFHCKLCECKFNNPNAKEMHMKGRRNRLQYKRKVQPDLVVDYKPTTRQKRIAEARSQKPIMMEAEYWNNRRNNDNDDDDQMYWDERRRFYDEFDYVNRMQRGYSGGPRGPHIGGPGPPTMGHPFIGMMPGRRPESFDDRHIVAHHAEIYPKDEELQTIQRIVSHAERALKFVSDASTDIKNDTKPVKNSVPNKATFYRSKKMSNTPEKDQSELATQIKYLSIDDKLQQVSEACAVIHSENKRIRDQESLRISQVAANLKVVGDAIHESQKEVNEISAEVKKCENKLHSAKQRHARLTRVLSEMQDCIGDGGRRHASSPYSYYSHRRHNSRYNN